MRRPARPTRLLAGLVCCLTALAAAPPPKPSGLPELSAKERAKKLEERDRLGQQVQRLWVAGKRPEALAAARKKLTLERQLFGPTHAEVVSSLQMLATLHELSEDFAAANKARQEVLAIQTKRFGAKHWQVTDARGELRDGEQRAKMSPEQRRRLGNATELDRAV